MKKIHSASVYSQFNLTITLKSSLIEGDYEVLFLKTFVHL
jgi:hypothetical protein